MIELIRSISTQLERLAIAKNINWKNTEAECEFLQIVNEDFLKHQKWIEEGIDMLEKNEIETADLAFSKILVGVRNLYLDFEAIDELLINFSKCYSQK